MQQHEGYGDVRLITRLKVMPSRVLKPLTSITRLVKVNTSTFSGRVEHPIGYRRAFMWLEIILNITVNRWSHNEKHNWNMKCQPLIAIAN